MDRATVGVKVAVNVAVLYVTPAGTVAPPAVFRSTVLAFTVAGLMPSLNVTLTVADGDTLVALLAGATAVTVGGVVSRA